MPTVYNLKKKSNLNDLSKSCCCCWLVGCIQLPNKYMITTITTIM